MAPAATWTTCPYEAKDGQVNNDRNQLYGLSQLNMASQSIIDNALASVLDRNPDAAEVASRFLDVFFIDKKRGISPHLEWGQTIRGPSQRGSYMGVLDLRVLVKVVNAIQILRISKTSHWSRERDIKMLQWAKSYLDWLENSELGKRPSKSANNHSSFYHGQLAALKILIGDKTGALKIVQAYFSGPFREQIVSSGEQPFESTRKKPFHYRAFNLEAMIALAKLGDYLGVSMWNTQTRYKSTIKTAIDYLITLDAGHEDTKVALPLVAAAMAVYGDNQGSTYRKYLEAQGTQTVNNGRTKVWKYMTKSWWFYEHPEAVRVSDSDHQTRAIYDLASQEIIGAPLFNSGSDTRNGYSSPDMHDYPELDNEWDDPYRFASANLPTHPERPPPFVLTDAVELEEGIYVYWSQISHLYDQSPGGRRSVWAKW
ncbi:hypothetical protein FRC19_011385 [Serendipita sp. 401]|nr:hypothetical protein FRC19_011385 [Serendipita sp. 401]